MFRREDTSTVWGGWHLELRSQQKTRRKERQKKSTVRGSQLRSRSSVSVAIKIEAKSDEANGERPRHAKSAADTPQAPRIKRAQPHEEKQLRSSWQPLPALCLQGGMWEGIEIMRKLRRPMAITALHTAAQ